MPAAPYSYPYPADLNNNARVAFYLHNGNSRVSFILGHLNYCGVKPTNLVCTVYSAQPV